jgi:hypothetical protein
VSDSVKAVFRHPFPEQLAAFRLRMLNLVPTAFWNSIMHSAHDRGFMVAGAMRADLLADLGAAVEKAIREGTTLDEFRRDFNAIVKAHNWHGWTGEGSERGEAWRTRTIYMTNLRTSYAAGRWVQIVEGGFKYVIYKHGGSLDPRPHHIALDGLVLPIDHPFWLTHSPPNGWGCSCYLIGARTLKDAYARGGDPNVSLPPDWNKIDPKTSAPQGIDKGWAYAPGRSVARTLTALAPKLAKLPAPIGAAWIDEWPDRLFATWSEAFAEFVSAAQAGPPRGAIFVVGAMKPQWVEAANKAGVAPIAADITATDKTIAHAFRDAKVNAVDLDWFKRLPEWLRNPDTVLLDTSDKLPTMLFFLKRGSENNRIVVKLQYRLKKVGDANLVVTTQEGHEFDIPSYLGQGYRIIE